MASRRGPQTGQRAPRKPGRFQCSRAAIRLWVVGCWPHPLGAGPGIPPLGSSLTGFCWSAPAERLHAPFTLVLFFIQHPRRGSALKSPRPPLAAMPVAAARTAPTGFSAAATDVANAASLSAPVGASTGRIVAIEGCLELCESLSAGAEDEQFITHEVHQRRCVRISAADKKTSCT
ncbi:hypothetical protein NDU88_000206 [Pleurodeles waltl]|uniref:Uncharacterized protein n=1 Tax=Pleurodeles waltl TaxID=8319 RepID=A0AAV7VST9_PLEWA|nr:hypothetical protein NDU88_000206 [Pleurodeles waltl]